MTKGHVTAVVDCHNPQGLETESWHVHFKGRWSVLLTLIKASGSKNQNSNIGIAFSTVCKMNSFETETRD